MKALAAAIRGSFFRIACSWARKGIISIGPGLKLYCKLEIRGEGRVSIGRNCVVSRVAGDNRHYVTIYTHSPTAFVSIGNEARLFGARISSKYEVLIGDDFLIEEAGIADTDFHSISVDRGEPHENPAKCRIAIGNRVSVGARSIVCKGVTIGNDALIYPGSIVKAKEVPEGSAVCGNPARVIREHGMPTAP
jgi:acetyltransferase-like isoleucine patch superfamily enzyme